MQRSCCHTVIKYVRTHSGGVFDFNKFRNVCKYLKPILFNGVLKVVRRLQNSPFNDDTKHPIILPCTDHAMNLFDTVSPLTVMSLGPRHHMVHFKVKHLRLWV